MRRAPRAELDDHHLRGFVRTQLESGLHVNTVRKNLKAAKPFYRCAAKEGIVDDQVSDSRAFVDEDPRVGRY